MRGHLTFAKCNSEHCTCTRKSDDRKRHCGSGFVLVNGAEGALDSTTVDTAGFGGLDARCDCSCWAGTVWMRTCDKQAIQINQ